MPNRTLANAGFAAAAASLTTSTSDMPVAVAVKLKSTPGYTSGYVTELPATAGAGSDPADHDTDTH